MMAKSFLEAQLRLLVDHFGDDRVQLTLRRIAGSGPPTQPGRRASGAKKKSRPRATAPEFVSKMVLADDHRRLLAEAAEKFQEKAFLPTVGDVRHFCEVHGVEGPVSGSRADAVPRVFRFLATLNADDLRTTLDSGMFSGPARLGPIADAILDAGRERRLERASREDGLSARGVSE